jgi:hypothetical protein
MGTAYALALLAAARPAWTPPRVSAETALPCTRVGCLGNLTDPQFCVYCGRAMPATGGMT